jgi:hypothetical protein
VVTLFTPLTAALRNCTAATQSMYMIELKIRG